jgi:hypothetical protein
MNNENMIPGGIAFALMTGRKELLSVTMRGLRREAEEGTLTGERLFNVLHALETLCESAIDASLKARGFNIEDEDENEEVI